MKPFDKFVGTDLWWRRVGLLSSRHELVDEDGSVYSSLVLEGILRAVGRAEASGLRLELRWSMLFKRGVRIRGYDSGEPVCSLRLSLLDRGEFVFSGGRRFLFRKGLVKRECSVTDDLGDILFTMTQKPLGGRTRVVIRSGLASRQDLLVMIVATQYAFMMMTQEAWSAAAGG